MILRLLTADVPSAITIAYLQSLLMLSLTLLAAGGSLRSLGRTSETARAALSASDSALRRAYLPGRIASSLLSYVDKASGRCASAPMLRPLDRERKRLGTGAMSGSGSSSGPLSSPEDWPGLNASRGPCAAAEEDRRRRREAPFLADLSRRFCRSNSLADLRARAVDRISTSDRARLDGAAHRSSLLVFRRRKMSASGVCEVRMQLTERASDPTRGVRTQLR